MKRRGDIFGWARQARMLALGGFWLTLWLGAFSVNAQVPAWVQSTNAVEFFTNLSSRLLSASGYPFDANNIPVYTNGTFVFSPDVRRVLQVAANIYDATTNHHTAPGDADLPTVLRPTFRRQVDGPYTNIYIGGFTEVGAVTGPDDPQFAISLDLNDAADRALAGTVPDQNIYDVPWIIGVKKGFPNFNEFAMRSGIQVSRKLQFRRITTASRPNATNQLYVVGISNTFGFEAWNSYPSNYARAVQVIVANDMIIGIGYTNDLALDQRGSNVSMHITSVAVTNLATNAWAGYGSRLSVPAKASFVTPLVTNIAALPASYFRTEPAPFFTPNINVGLNLFSGFEQTGLFPLPHFNLSVSNRIRFISLDTASGRVIDYVQLSGLNGNMAYPWLDETFWQTNRPAGGSSLSNAPLGVINQISASLGLIDVEWNTLGSTKEKQIDAFRSFFQLSSLYGTGEVDTNLFTTAPFTPTRIINQYVTWQANDPLVHFTRQDLLSSYPIGLGRELPGAPPLKNIGSLNDRFEPWGGNPISSLSPVPLFSVAYRDPLANSSITWDFAERGPLSVAWLGKVHRGTPWQTLYLKSGDVAPSTWLTCLGGWDQASASRARPVNDRSLVSTLAALLNTNSPASLLSVNSADTNAWKQVLGGLVVFTNASTYVELTSTPPVMRFETNVMNAASPQASVIAGRILQARGGVTWITVGDVLKTTELSEGSPWLNTNSAVQLHNGISDEAYEIIASQLLPRLRQDSVGAVISIEGAPTIEFSGYDGFPYSVEVSADLVNWSGISTNYPVNGEWRFTDVGGAGAGQRFYRSRLLP